MSNENGVSGVGILLVVIACALISTMLSGCGVRFDMYYYGQTPVGLDNKQATAISAQTRPVVRNIKVED